MSFRNLLNQSVTIQRRTDTTDDQGGYTNTWATLLRRVKCRFNALSSNEMAILYDKQKIIADFKVYLEYQSTIKEGDRILFGTRTFDIKLVNDWDEVNKYQRLYVAEVAHGE
jgi:SPP1 family predicted phage head-tail adaptor